jgi:hypothetical protein
MKFVVFHLYIIFFYKPEHPVKKTYQLQEEIRALLEKYMTGVANLRLASHMRLFEGLFVALDNVP